MRDRLANVLWFGSGMAVAVLAMAGPPAVTAHAQGATPPATPAPHSLWERAFGTISDTAARYTSDEAVADCVIASVAKQERVNKILAKRGCSYRVSEMRVSISVPPALEVGVSEVLAEAPAPATDAH